VEPLAAPISTIPDKCARASWGVAIISPVPALLEATATALTEAATAAVRSSKTRRTRGTTRTNTRSTRAETTRAALSHALSHAAHVRTLLWIQIVLIRLEPLAEAAAYQE